LRPKEQARANELRQRLLDFDANIEKLPGIHPPGHLECLVEQFVESRRRIEFVHHVRDAQHDDRRMDPNSSMFDPLRAAVLHHRKGRTDEAYWLVFLATHFGKHMSDGWRLVQDVYGKLGGPGRWDWATICANPVSFRPWLAANRSMLIGRRFSNHRKFESLSATSSKGTAAVIESYVAWVSPPQTHQQLIQAAHTAVGQHPHETFDFLYKSLAAVKRFGRLGKFDYLTMLGKLGIAPIEPGSAYLWDNASGPLPGSRLLFDGNASSTTRARTLDVKLVRLNDHMEVGMQAMEDALCNWQKSPAQFIAFKG
jgi:hypothetical protein